MKKRVKILIGIAILALIIALFVLNYNKINIDDTVEIWWYEYENDRLYNSLISRVVSAVTFNLNANGMPVKEVKYSYKDISYSDYVFKRNIALTTQNALTVDDSKKLYSLRHYHDDYSKVEKYAADSYLYKEKYCMPMGVYSECLLLNKDIFDYYNIEVDLEKLYLYSDFLKLKQRLKENGARFSLVRKEYYYTIDYYIDKYKLNMSDLLEPEYIAEDEYMKLLKTAIIDIYNDFNSYYDDELNYKILLENDTSLYFGADSDEIYDMRSNLMLMSTSNVHPFYIVDYVRATTEFHNKIPVLVDNYYDSDTLKNPCIFIYNRKHNKNVYTVANELIKETNYEVISPKNPYGGRTFYYLPTHSSHFVHELIGVGEDFKNNSALATMVKLGQKRVAEQLRLMDLITSNVMLDYGAQIQIANNFSRDGGVEALYVFIAEQLNRLHNNGGITKELDDSIYRYTKNYYIRIK